MRLGIIPRVTVAVVYFAFTAFAVACSSAITTPELGENIAVTPTLSTIATATSSGDPSPTPRPTHTPTATPSATPTAQVEPSPTPAPKTTPTPTVEPTATPTPVPAPTATPVLAATHTPQATPTPEPTPEAESSPFLDHADCDNLSFRSRLPEVNLTITYRDVALTVKAEVADDGAERSQGLMCRRTLPDGTGMIFVFSVESTQAFWMFNTYVPLDIVYLGADRLAFQALRMEPCPRPEAASDAEWQVHCGRAVGGYTSSKPAKFAIELPAGWMEQNGIPLSEVGEVQWAW